MKILFVSSGNSSSGISPIIKNQAESLISMGCDVDVFTIKGKGLKGYIINILSLRKFLMCYNFDIIHAHFGLSGLVSLIAKRKEKLVVSFMGDDILGSNKSDGSLLFLSRLMVIINRILSKKYYNATIVKSKEMLISHGKTDSLFLIPNGVNIDKFRPLPKEKCQKDLGWPPGRIYLLFASNPARIEKNFALLEKAMQLIPEEFNIDVKVLQDVPNESIPTYMNAADIVILTSFHEGSPNVIKEAMACNRPIISTDVGDVRLILGDTNGCLITDFDPKQLAEKIIKTLSLTQVPDGRNRILALGLDSQNIARKITELYSQLINVKCAELQA
jgi:glycosyltransferase involved in cell wall biosynthesis